MINLEIVNNLIGKPYNKNTFNCWTLIELIVPNAPKVDIEVDSVTTTVKKIDKELKDNIDNFTYPNMGEEIEGDIVLFGHGDNMYNHAGVYYNNIIIHNDTQGVRTEKYDIMKNKYKNVKILRVKNDNNS